MLVIIGFYNYCYIQHGTDMRRNCRKFNTHSGIKN